MPYYRLITLALLCLTAFQPTASANPVELWKDFDPDAGDFKEEIVHEETTGGIYRRDTYISAYVNGEEIRVYCKYAVKAGAKNAPGLMDIHGWMGRPAFGNEYIDAGWAVMSHDYCGKSGNRQHYTRYPEKLKYGNMDGQHGYRVKSKLPDGSFITDPKQTDDYLWYAIQRRVLSYLLEQKEVDADRIGAKGYSYGGTIMWNLGTDSRVKAVVAYFGVGWLEYYRTRGVYMYDVPPNNPEPSPGEKLYLSTIAPQAHAPHITAASLWLNGTNDHHGGHERGEQTFNSFSKNVPWSFAHQPRGHHDTQDIGHNTKLWLDKHVLGREVHWPEQAQSKIVLDAKGVPELHISPADSGKVTELKMYYALKNPVSFGRAWRDCETMVRRGDTWVGSMPVMNVDDYVFGFGSIRYDNTVVRSSPFSAAIPSKLGNAKATDKPSNQLSEGTGAWINVGPVQGKGGIKGFRALTPRGAFNEQFSDPKWKAPAGALLAFKFYCTQPQDLILVVNDHNEAKIPIPASNDWQEMSLDATRFINRHSNKPLEDWSSLHKLQLKPAPKNDITKVVFADFRWQTKPAQKASPPRPVAQLKAKQKIPAGQRVYLKKEMATVVESFNTVNNNRAWQGSPIRIGGKTYKRGLGVHADSKLVFDLNSEFATFHVVPGPDDAHKGTLSMKILVDEKEVFSSGSTSSRDKKARRPLNINVTGAKQLTLLVSAGDSRGGDHASWADAWLERPSETAWVAPVIEHAGTTVPREKLEPFLKEYCIDCHGPKKQKGQVRFDGLSWEIANNDTAQRWQDVLDQLNGGDMPPEDATQPFDDEMSAALDTLTGTILTARRRLTDHGGEIKMRRLNRREYSNSINHLFGFDVPIDTLPEDGEFKSFDTVGAEQFFTSSHFEKYLELGRNIMKEAFRHSISPRKKATIQRSEAEQKVNEAINKQLAELEAKQKLRDAGKSWQEMGFNDEGAMKYHFDAAPRIEGRLQNYMANPHAKQGAYITHLTGTTTRLFIGRHSDIRGEYILRIHGGVVGDPLPMRRIARVHDGAGTRATLGLRGTPEKPETVEVRLRQSVGRFGLMLSVSENVPPGTFGNSGSLLKHLERLQGSADPLNALWVDWLEIDGPYYPEEKSFFEQIMTQDGPADKSKYMKDEHAAELIEKFAREAFRRRPPAPAFLSGLQSRFRELRAEGAPFEDAMSEVCALILAAPSFLYLQEAETSGSGVKHLDNRELAVRLSYFLWSAPPDAPLYAADISDPTTRATQVDRLLASPKAKAFRDGFISQWAEIDRFNAITIDEKDEPRFNTGVRHSANREVREFFGTLIKENLPARNLIDSDFITINPTLAAHYDIAGVAPKDDRFVKVKLPAGSPRGGLMTQAAFLITGSNGERSSPVIRGALVMDKLLHDAPAPPPPNVPELSEASSEPKTNREMVKIHQRQAVCASCHKKMDVIGFGLENFDTIGRWRDTEPVGKQQVAIDPSGTLPDGSAFATVRELKAALLKHETDLAKGLVESILAYGLGRTVEFSDADDVEEILAQLAGDSYPVRSMIREIALSPLFERK